MVFPKHFLSKDNLDFLLRFQIDLFQPRIHDHLHDISKSNNAEEIKTMLEALKWKYHGDDHVFLAEIDLFGILRGNQDCPLLRSAWGKPFE